MDDANRNATDEWTNEVGPLNQLLGEARAHLTAAERLFGVLADDVRELAERAAHEQSELQRHLEEFMIERVIFDQADRHREEDAGPLLDIAAIRTNAHELNVSLARTRALHQNIEAVHHLLQIGGQQLAGDQAFIAVQDTTDPRLQHAMAEAREDERSRLAREIHDGPAQVLTNAIYGIQIAEQVARRSPEQVGAELLRLRELLKDGVAEIRRFMSDLRPTMLQDHGLVVTVHHYVGEYNRFFSKSFSLETTAEPLALTPEQELTLFRVIQEALQNIHKHAGSSANAAIVLSRDETRLLLTVSDDGHGFDPATIGPRATSGAGLPGMRERAKLAGADLRIESAPGSGTVVRLQLPLRPAPPARDANGADNSLIGRDREGAR